MKVKIIYPSFTGLFIAIVIIFIGLLCADGYNNMESTKYSNVKNCKDFEKWYESMNYLDAFPQGEHAEEVSKIFYEAAKSDGRIKWIYGCGEHFSNIPLGEELKNLSYQLALERNNFESWEEYLETADSAHIYEAQNKLDSIRTVSIK